MAKINIPIATKNLKKNFPLLLSTVAALCLFLSPSLSSLLMIAAIFVAVVMVALLDLANPPVISNSLIRLAVVMIAMLIEFMGYDAFKTTWIPSSKVAALANALHLTTPILLLIVGLGGCIVGSHAMYALSCWIVTWGTQLFKERLSVQKKAEIVSNLKRNWCFPIYAMAFFCLNSTLTLGYFVRMLIAFMTSLVVASQIPSIFNFAKRNYKRLYVVAIMTLYVFTIHFTEIAVLIVRMMRTFALFYIFFP